MEARSASVGGASMSVTRQLGRRTMHERAYREESRGTLLWLPLWFRVVYPQAFIRAGEAVSGVQLATTKGLLSKRLSVVGAVAYEPGVSCQGTFCGSLSPPPA